MPAGPDRPRAEPPESGSPGVERSPRGGLGRLLEAERAIRARREAAEREMSALIEEARGRARDIRNRTERELESGLGELRERIAAETERARARIEADASAEEARWEHLPEGTVEALARLVRERLVGGAGDG